MKNPWSTRFFVTAKPMNRKYLAVGILGVWLGALGWLLKREYLGPGTDLLPDASFNVSPGATYYRLLLGDVQIGFQSISVDTVADTVRVSNFTLLNVPAAGRGQRLETRMSINLSRSLQLRSFEWLLRDRDARVRVNGAMDGDSLLYLELHSIGGSQGSELQLDGPLVLPALVPMQMAFGSNLAIGQSYNMNVFDPLLLKPRPVELRVTAESTFVIPDSADQPEGQLEWIPARWDTVHAWYVTYEGDNFEIDAWIDDLGQIVSARTPTGFRIERTAFEIAYENFSRGDSVPVFPPRRGTDLVRQTTAAANVAPNRPVQKLWVRLDGIDLARIDLDGSQQRLLGDTLVVSTVDSNSLRATWRLPNRDGQLARYLKPDPLMLSTDPRIEAQARQAIGSTRNPRRAANALVDWVYTEIDERVSEGAVNAVDVLISRGGNASEQTALLVAMARAVELPARPVSGLVYLDSRFYYHAWAEVYLDDWVPVDPTHGQFPADASHLRFVVGGFARQLELLRALGNLSLDVLEARTE